MEGLEGIWIIDHVTHIFHLNSHRVFFRLKRSNLALFVTFFLFFFHSGLFRVWLLIRFDGSLESSWNQIRIYFDKQLLAIYESETDEDLVEFLRSQFAEEDIMEELLVRSDTELVAHT